MFKKFIKWITSLKKVKILTPGITVFRVSDECAYDELIDYFDITDNINIINNDYEPYRHIYFTDFINTDRFVEYIKYDESNLVIDLTHFNEYLDTKYIEFLNTRETRSDLRNLIDTNKFDNSGVICIFIINKQLYANIRDINLHTLLLRSDNILSYDSETDKWIVNKSRKTGKYYGKKFKLSQLIRKE